MILWRGFAPSGPFRRPHVFTVYGLGFRVRGKSFSIIRATLYTGFIEVIKGYLGLRLRGFPKLGVSWGVPIIRLIRLWGLFWGPPLLGNYHVGRLRVCGIPLQGLIGVLVLLIYIHIIYIYIYMV